jgi:hypothetical protein
MKKLLLVLVIVLPFVLNAQNDAKKMPSVVLKHYSEKELQEIKLKAPKKIDQIIFLYTQSFKISNPSGKKLMASTANFDVADYNNQRKENQRVKITINHNGDQVELFSWNEVKSEYTKLMNQ